MVNGTYLLSPGMPPFAPPPGGWRPQTVAFLDAMAAADLANAVISVAFVTGFLRGVRWSAWLGTFTLAISMYAASVFTYGLWAAGAFEHEMSDYLWVYLPFIPVALLFIGWFYWLIAGSLMVVRDDP